MLCMTYVLLELQGLKLMGEIVDTMIAGSLVDENRFRYDLGSMGRDYLGKGKNEAIIGRNSQRMGCRS